MPNFNRAGAAAGLMALTVSVFKYVTNNMNTTTTTTPVSEMFTSVSGGMITSTIIPLFPTTTAITDDTEPSSESHYISPAATHAMPLNWLFILLLFLGTPGFTHFIRVGGQAVSKALSKSMSGAMDRLPRPYGVMTRHLWKCYCTADSFSRLFAAVFLPGQEIIPLQLLLLTLVLCVLTKVKWFDRPHVVQELWDSFVENKRLEEDLRQASNANAEAADIAKLLVARISNLEGELKLQKKAADSFEIGLAKERVVSARTKTELDVLQKERLWAGRYAGTLEKRNWDLEAENQTVVPLTQQNRSLTKNNVDLVGKNERLTKQKSWLQQETDELQKLLRKYGKDKVEFLQEDVKFVRNQIVELHGSIELSEEQYREKDKELIAVRKTKDDLAVKLAASEGKVASTQEWIGELEEQVEFYKKEKIAIMKEKDGIQKQRDALKKDHGVGVNKALRKEIAEVRKSEFMARNEITTLTKENNTLTKDKATAEENNKTLLEEKATLERNYKELDQMKKALEHDYDELADETQEERAALEEEIATLEEKTTTLEGKSETLAKENAAIKNTNAFLEKGTPKLLDYFDNLEKDAIGLKKDYRTLKKRHFTSHRKYGGLLKDYNKLLRSAETMRHAFRGLRQKHDQLAEKSANDDRNLDFLRRLRGRLEKSIRKLEEEILSIGRVFDRREANYERIIDERDERVSVLEALASAVQDELANVTDERDDWMCATMHFRKRVLNPKKGAAGKRG